MSRKEKIEARYISSLNKIVNIWTAASPKKLKTCNFLVKCFMYDKYFSSWNGDFCSSWWVGRFRKNWYFVITALALTFTTKRETQGNWMWIIQHFPRPRTWKLLSMQHCARLHRQVQHSCVCKTHNVQMMVFCLEWVCITLFCTIVHAKAGLWLRLGSNMPSDVGIWRNSYELIKNMCKWCINW